MWALMDKLHACLTEIDMVIQRQRRAMATVAALSNMSDLETARQHIRATQNVLMHIEGDALPAQAPPTTP